MNGYEDHKFADKAALAEFYRKSLLDRVISHWEDRTIDESHGGYVTCFDRRWQVTETDKYIWFQGRQLWMFSALYNRIEKNGTWLDIAKLGRDFLRKHAYAGKGRWYYHLDRVGNVKKGTVSLYTDLFVLQGLCEYTQASGTDEDTGIIEETYFTAEKNIRDREFRDLYHGTWSNVFKRHGPFMIGLNTAQVACRVLGRPAVQPLIDHCLEQILFIFAKDEHRALFESVGYNGFVIHNTEGHLLNPGHALESMWFCLEEGIYRNDRDIIDRAVKVLDWMYERGGDKEQGGIYAFVDLKGGRPKQTDWHKETGMLWDDKNWWAHSEALYATALAAVQTGRQDLGEIFMNLHAWCWNHFYDEEHGEWYPELYRDGTIKLADKGTLWKAAYHLPRALLKLADLFSGKYNLF